MIIELFKNVKDNTGSQLDTSWDEIYTLLMTSDLTAERSRKKEMLCFTGCRFDGTRAKAHARDACLIALDVDNGWDLFDAHWAMEDMLCPYVIYTTTKHTRDHHRFRIVIPLDREIQADEYDALWCALGRRMAPLGGVLDKATRDISRLSVMPVRWTGASEGLDYSDTDPVTWGRRDGIALDVEAMIRAHPAPEIASDPVEPLGASISATGDGWSYSAERSLMQRWRASKVDPHTLSDIHTSPIVPQDRLSREMTTSDSGRAYRFLCACALKGLSQGYEVDERVLTSLGEQFSRLVGRKQDGLAVDVKNALYSARRKVGV